MTLFASAAKNENDRHLFTAVLEKYFGGELDPLTLERL
jgi:uncharacterized protein (DUF1810 family)